MAHCMARARCSPIDHLGTVKIILSLDKDSATRHEEVNYWHINKCQADDLRTLIIRGEPS
jgi:hypothetical protein